jgi:hydroxyacylglutathione hydrolase
MILKQYYLGCLAQASYLIGDLKSKRAAIVDPRRDTQEYLDDARALGLSIGHVLLSHFHADFVSGHLELQELTGATIHLGARATAEFAFVPMADGSALELGSVRLEVLETPGHTPESICIVVYDGSDDRRRPRAVLTGDTLFIGDVGRPDLMASTGFTAHELAGQLYESLHGKLLRLPDDTLVYPGHGAGSMCGKNLGSETVSTLGAQRRSNYALQPMPKDEFIRLVTADQLEAPAYFAFDAQLNRSRRAILPESMQRGLRPLSLPALLALRAHGAQLLDAREAADFARAHLAGSVNIGLGGSYATWAGTLLDRDRPIVIVCEPGREYEATMRLGRIGLDHVAGFLQGGIDAAAPEPQALHPAAPAAESLWSLDRITPLELAVQLRAAAPPVVLDVRTTREWQEKRIATAIHVPLTKLRERMGELPADRPLVVHCAGGYRSSTAASLLRNAGHGHVADLAGGIDAWVQAGHPVETALAIP